MAMPDTERLIHLEQQMSMVGDKITQIGNEVRSAGEDMKRILSLLVGNVLDRNDGGIVGRIELNRKDLIRLEECIDKLEETHRRVDINRIPDRLTKVEEKFKRIGWTIVGVAIGSGVGGFTLAKFMEFITLKK